ncbi:MAG: heavy-metal-associated domain-containing protein [Nitrospirae bacterium]|nr:heavy-metal-associated domain-containing protein [Nitrospirota bacterium]
MALENVKIEGMSCEHCVARVKKAIDAIDGVLKSDVSIGSATVEYDDAKTGRDQIVKAIEGVGYKVVG